MFLLPLAACGGAAAECVTWPCPQPIAIALTISTAVTGAGVPLTTVDVSGAMRSSFSCSGTCRISGTAGTYHIVAHAPGFEPVERSIEVRGTTPACGCATTVVQDVTIVLGASAASVSGPGAPVL